MRSSTALLLADPKNIAIESKIFVDPLKLTLKKLESDYKELEKKSDDKKYWDALSESQKIENEKAKLAIVLEINKSIENQYGKIAEKKEKPAEKKAAFWRKALFGFLIIIDITFMCIGGFLGATSLLQMIPGITSVTTALVAGLTTAIESLMMYSIFKPMLQQGLGIPVNPPKETLSNYYGQRLELTEKVNSKMVNNGHYTFEKSPELYQSYAGILKTINKDMKKTTLTSFNEPSYKKVGRYCLSGLNLILSMAGTYFGTVMLLTAISPLLLGTPVGWAIIGTFILAHLISKLVIRQNSIFNLLNPSAHRHEEIRNKLLQFEDKSSGIDYDLHHMKKVDKAEKTQRIKVEENLLKPNSQVKKIQECPVFFKPCEPLSYTTDVNSDHLKRRKSF